MESREGSLTYAELVAMGERTAAALAACGVTTGDTVALCVKRTHRLAAALLGVLFSGASYVAVDPAAPRQRREFIIVDSGAKLLLGDEDQPDELPCPHLRLEEAVATCTSSEPLPEGRPGDVAYVSYTSGSSGHPKGVVIEQRSVVNLLLSTADVPGLQSHDRLLAITSLTFDISALELLLPLVTGATLVIADENASRQPLELIDDIERFGITCLQATPTTWRMLQISGWPGSKEIKALCGGEPLSADLAGYLAQAFGSAWNMYGPTETTIWSSCKRIDDGVPVRLGRPMRNTQLYVVDEQLAIVPPGVPGELVIGGWGVARGYRNRADLTESQFVPDRFQPGEGNRLYRTGDRVRQHVDGSLEFLGRLDFQLKIRGHRIEPGEIESLLRQHPAVDDAIIKAGANHSLAAWVVVGDPQSPPDEELLREYLRERVEAYKVPSSWTFLGQFPLLPSGKVDRNKLIPVERPASRSTPPVDETQRWLHEVWCALLSKSQIGVDEDFFELGGHSLLAVILLREIREKYELELSLAVLFDSATIESLASCIRLASQDRPQDSLA